MAAKRKREEMLQSLIDTLKLCSAKVKEGTLDQVMEDLETNFSMEEFSLKLGLTFKAVSKEATTLVMAFYKPPEPKPKDLENILTGFETVIVALLTVFHSLPLSEGHIFNERLQCAVLLIVEDAQALVDSILKEGCNSSLVKNKCTGALWEHCDVFEALPKNNKQAVLEIFRSTTELVGDAVAEVEKVQKSCGLQDEHSAPSDYPDAKEEGWSSSDRLLVPPSAGLVKACRSCLKKVSSAVKGKGEVSSSSTQYNTELDDTAKILREFSLCVDDLVLSLYAPMNHCNVAENATKLADNLKSFLAKARESHFTVEADSSWLDFLNNAVDHNVKKLMVTIPGNSPEAAT